MQNFGSLIKEIRKKNHLTQKDFADKYHVTYQAVSKWENNKNLPDVTLMKEISRDFNVSLDDMIDGNFNKKKNHLLIVLIFFCMISLIILIILINNRNDFKTKSISSMCDDYQISGIISYNSSKSLIYIPKIEYCKEENTNLYKEINCTLYEKNNNIIKEVSTYYYEDEITLKDFMGKVSFNVDNYLKVCKEFNDNSFYLEIKAKDKDNNLYYHEIPLSVEDNCK